MWTPTLSRSEGRLRTYSTARWRRRRPGAAAFTLIELLVVVAIIALLISILLPYLRGAREQARAAACGAIMRDVGTGLGTYVGSNEDWIPGRNTTGVAVQAKSLLWGNDPNVLGDSRLPVQSWDWMTPIYSQVTELPASRPERFKFLLEKFRCPSHKQVNSVPWNGSTIPEGLPAFTDLAPWPAVSYLMSAHFQYFGQNDARNRWLGYKEHPSQGGMVPILATAASPDWEVLVNDYIPRIDRVGPAARKVFVADGTRYLDRSLALDHDVSPHPTYFGAFTSSGAWWSGSRAYGVRRGTHNWDGSVVREGSISQGQNLALSYRHGGQSGVASGSALDNKGSIIVVCFDGHAQRLSDRQSREVHLWYPTGAIVQLPGEGMMNVPEGFVIP